MDQVQHLWGDIVQVPGIQGEEWEEGMEYEEEVPVIRGEEWEEGMEYEEDDPFELNGADPSFVPI